MTAVANFTYLDPILHLLATLMDWPAAPKDRPAESPEELRARRSFILEMMQSCPEAFDHEESFRCAMGFYSGRL